MDQKNDALAKLSISELVRSYQHRKANGSHEPYGFELFRRAIIEKSEESWSAIYRLYRPLVYLWIQDYEKGRSSIGISLTGDLVQDTFTSFWRSYSHLHFQKALSLGSVLKYLKTCAWSSVQHAYRRQEFSKLPVELSPTLVEEDKANMDTNIIAEELWRIIDFSCVDEQDRIVARQSILGNLKPKAILELYSGMFSGEKEIYDRRRNLRDRLQRNPMMQAYWEIS